MRNRIITKATISEMADNLQNLKIEVPVTDIDIKELTGDDPEPMFVTLEAVNEGISRNNVHYNKKILDEIAQQVNLKKPDAHSGHIPDSQRSSLRPDPITIWLGAAVKFVGGKNRLFIKGYVLPYAKELRTYLRSAKAAAKKVAVSIYGQAEHAWNQTLKAYDLKPGTFSLESIDWARSGSEGVPSMGYLSITAEMEGSDSVDRVDTIRSLTLDEVTSINPELVAEMEGVVAPRVKTELKREVATEVKGEFEKKIADKEKIIAEQNKQIVDLYLDMETAVHGSNLSPIIKKLVIAEMAGHDTTIDNARDALKKTLESSEITGILRSLGSRQPNILNDNKAPATESRSMTVVR